MQLGEDSGNDYNLGEQPFVFLSELLVAASPTQCTIVRRRNQLGPGLIHVVYKYMYMYNEWLTKLSATSIYQGNILLDMRVLVYKLLILHLIAVLYSKI